jgi:hypothetical protein
MWYLYTMELFSATKKTEILLLTGCSLESIIVCAVNQAQKAKIHIFSLICGL